MISIGDRFEDRDQRPGRKGRLVEVIKVYRDAESHKPDEMVMVKNVVNGRKLRISIKRLEKRYDKQATFTMLGNTPVPMTGSGMRQTTAPADDGAGTEGA